MSIVKKLGLMIATIIVASQGGLVVADNAAPAITPSTIVQETKPALPGVTPPINSAATTQTANTKTTVVPIGKVVWVKGSFLAIMPNHEKRQLKKDGFIFKGDTLITDDKSQAQIVFSDTSLMTFREGTKFEIKEYDYKPEEKKSGSVGKYFMNLIEGGFRTITGLIPKANPKDYSVQTPVATIGVRGTDYSVYLQKGGGLFIGQLKGAPCVSTEASGEPLCLDEKNQYAKVDESSGVPIPLSQRPEVFDQPLTIVPVRNVSFAPNAGVRPSSFCIQ